jgi:2-polyprenyl-3-methyl-5-hydroxy-6-metoxy-1,4-benzoquinol methylase
MFELYKEIFLNKTRKRTKVYTETKQEHIDNNREFLELKFIKVVNNILENEEKFDYIILENVLEKDDFHSIIHKYKEKLKTDGVIMFINTLETKRSSCILENIIYYTYLFTGIDYRTINIEDVYRNFYVNELKIIDIYRLHCESNLLSYKETYLVSCISLSS